jgi:hypothetical protein
LSLAPLLLVVEPPPPLVADPPPEEVEDEEDEAEDEDGEVLVPPPPDALGSTLLALADGPPFCATGLPLPWHAVMVRPALSAALTRTVVRR